MLRILGSSQGTGAALTRRDLLRASIAVPALASLSSADAPVVAIAPRAKRVLLLYLYGAAAQHETFDPKPDAPAEIRGEFSPISTAIPGIGICEHLPKVAALLDRVTVIRSMTHPYNIHSAAYTMTGVDFVDVPMELNPYDGRHWPSFQSILEYRRRQQNPNAPLPEVPYSMGLPFPFSSRAPEFLRGGPYGGFLGQSYNPIWTNFEGESSKSVNRWRGDRDNLTPDPYLGITPASRLTVSSAAVLPPEVTLDRLDRRRNLLQQFETELCRFDEAPKGRHLTRFQDMAYSMLTSRALREALDVGREPLPLRERYGMTLFGQSTLVARRLLEAGAGVVTVMWDEYGPANTAWDTHFDHYERLKTELLPGLDSALSTLLIDLEDRGMLDDTLVLCLTEHGRTPKLTLEARGVGREHWSQTYCNLLAGGGIARGRVIGASDAQGAFVKENPISPKDVLATLYHLLGIDLHGTVPDRFGRPYPLVSHGRVITEALG